jgi:hypothetical protein
MGPSMEMKFRFVRRRDDVSNVESDFGIPGARSGQLDDQTLVTLPSCTGERVLH